MSPPPSYVAGLLTLLTIPGLSPPSVFAQDRAVAVLLDTSGSMDSSDRQRYTVQITKILSDLLADSDRLTAIGMANMELTCSFGSTPIFEIDLDTNRRREFKSRLDGSATNRTGTFFGAAIRVAADMLEDHRQRRRLLLILADSGGLGGCAGPLTGKLTELHDEGVLIAAVNLGTTSGAFDRNPAFDLTAPALDAHELVTSVGEVYQRFLGAKKVQSGRVRGETIEVEIAPLVRRAFLVVAADGPLGRLEGWSRNPSATRVDLAFRNGVTKGLDRVDREYRIVELEEPMAGAWRFETPDLEARAGWLLIQDLIPIEVRLRDIGAVAAGKPAVLEATLHDDRGRQITDLSAFPGLTVKVEVEGPEVLLADDGTSGDRQAGDGVLSGLVRMDTPGNQQVSVVLQDYLRVEKTVQIDLEVVEAVWRIEVRTRPWSEAGSPVELSVALQPEGNPTLLAPVERVEVLTGDDTVILRDDGNGLDHSAGDGLFTGSWTPRQPGLRHLDYIALGESGGERLAEASVPIEVVGRLRLGTPPPLQFGDVGSGGLVEGRLDLEAAEVEGEFVLAVTSDLDLARSALEIETGDGWIELGSKPVVLPLSTGDPKSWPVRLRVGECPEGTSGAEAYNLSLASEGPGGLSAPLLLPISVRVMKDPWLECWWPVLALLAGGLTVGVVIHGYWTPARFPGRYGVRISSEEDTAAEGYFLSVAGNSAARSGFYRDASVYITFGGLRSKPKGAMALLQARKRSRVQAIPVAGVPLWRKGVDGEWEEVPPDGFVARYNTLFRNDSGTLYFEPRTG